jgi:hypothetical protein
MATEDLHLGKVLDAVRHVLNAFNFPEGASVIERATANGDNAPNTAQLLANLQQELTHLPSLMDINMNGEMRHFIQALIDNIRAATTIDKACFKRSMNKLYRALEPFARSDTQRAALAEMQAAKESALGIEPIHRGADKREGQSDECTKWQEEENDEE